MAEPLTQTAEYQSQTIDPEMAYDLRRAGEERARAHGSTNVWARAAHHELALAYERRVWRRDPQLLSTVRTSGGGR